MTMSDASRSSRHRRGRLLGGVCALVVLLSSCGEDSDDYVAENDEILAEIDAFPGADLVETASTPYTRNDSGIGGPDGYVTAQVYRVTRETGAITIADHYATQLDGWTESRSPGCELDCEDGEELVVSFTRGAAIITLAFDNFTAGTFELSVDHDAAG